MEGGRWKVDFLHVKETNLGKIKGKHWPNRREGRRLEEEEEEDDDDEGEETLFFARVYAR